MMELRCPAPGAVDVAQLRVELEAAGIFPTEGSRDGTDIELLFEDDATVDSILCAQIIAAHVPSEFADLELLVAKARNVWAGTDTFTVAQVQKILAGLVLIVARHLR